MGILTQQRIGFFVRPFLHMCPRVVTLLTLQDGMCTMDTVATLWLPEVVMRTMIRKIGNSLGNIIPAALIRQLELEEGREIDITSEDGKIIIEPLDTKKKRLPFSEAELLAGLTAHTAHADELATLSSKELDE